MKETTANPTLSEVAKPVKPDFGAGRYSALMESSFKDAQVVFGLSPEKAEKLARQIASDFGAAMRNTEVTAKIGKTVSKDGKVSLSEAAKAKGIACTNALQAMRALGYAAEAGKFGFNWKASFGANSLIGGEGSLKEYFDTL